MKFVTTAASLLLWSSSSLLVINAQLEIPSAGLQRMGNCYISKDCVGAMHFPEQVTLEVCSCMLDEGGEEGCFQEVLEDPLFIDEVGTLSDTMPPTGVTRRTLTDHEHGRELQGPRPPPIKPPPGFVWKIWDIRRIQW